MRLTKLLAAPSFLWFLAFVLAPLALIAAMSFAHRGPYGQVVWELSFANYATIFSGSVWNVYLRTVFFAGWTSLACVGLGVVAAWAMASANRWWRDFYLALVAVPFLTNGLIRILGLKSFVSVDGPLDALLRWFDIPHDPFALSTNSTLVAVGMISAYLPFAVLPLFGAFERFDFALIEAAQDLGAGWFVIFYRIILPVLARPLAGAAFLVFIPALGEYLIPDLLGGAKTQLLGNLITERFLKSRDWPQGSAQAVSMIMLLFFGWIFVSRCRKSLVKNAR